MVFLNSGGIVLPHDVTIFFGKYLFECVFNPSFLFTKKARYSLFPIGNKRMRARKIIIKANLILTTK